MPSATRMLNSIAGHHRIPGLSYLLGLGREPSRKTYLRLEQLSLHLQRDIGFTDGNRPCGRSR